MGSHFAAASMTCWMVALALASSWDVAVALGAGKEEKDEMGGGRLLLAFTETKGNVSFRCSPSGPCLPCKYFEKNDEKHHCSETGYHVPLKCSEIADTESKEIKNKVKRRLSSIQEHSTIVEEHVLTAIDNFKWRKLLRDSSSQDFGNQSYISYRSCIPVDGEEKLSVLGFEVIMVGLLLISGPIVYVRQKRCTSIPGAGFMRIPVNAPRF
ncbi:hypothetical protein Cni_G12067 [Canna indica]|uniref:Uncharacterized protein n=1 Tax=Canna indica TaxID=4628 RepID=A0AAQ3KB89_9LILI|nr:hypothetical protein Cni_G12067 [Canna indica]